MSNYTIKDIALAEEGHKKIRWVKGNMPILSGMEETFQKTKPFQGVRMALSIHMEAKTAYLCRVLVAGGAQLAATGSNVLSTQDDVVAALADSGVQIHAIHGASEEEYYQHIERTLEIKPEIIIDDGGDLVHMVHTQRKDLGQEVWGGCEETTTGILRLKAMEREGLLKFPMIAVNDAQCKYLFDNRYGTGQSVWASIMTNTNLIVAGKTVVVAGYGWCSRGIALRAKALGAQVIITEINPIKAMEAKMDGHEVMTMDQASSRGDIFVTATGCKDTITLDHMEKMKDGVILANAGHFNVEIDMKGLEEQAQSQGEARKNITAYHMPWKKIIHVIGEGKLVNIAAADGHPAEIMDLSFALQVMGALYIKENHGKLANKVMNLPPEIDREVAKRRLKAWGIDIDRLTQEQQEYLDSWEG